MGNDNRSKIVDKGDVCLETNIDCRLILKDVIHVPNMHMPSKQKIKCLYYYYSNSFMLVLGDKLELKIIKSRDVVFFED
uniref:Retrovirus-related Pol polyprotein from transposon TNT 1-94 n=1 Tax=Cajanus cajan TaxID=3821 RepID=A0A151SZ79_CAJCA|nr:Retrovirus-related Pol polyprotein from transposon TNT 1-94 [Cajanus cajan]